MAEHQSLEQSIQTCRDGIDRAIRTLSEGDRRLRDAQTTQELDEKKQTERLNEGALELLELENEVREQEEELERLRAREQQKRRAEQKVEDEERDLARELRDLERGESQQQQSLLQELSQHGIRLSGSGAIDLTVENLLQTLSGIVEDREGELRDVENDLKSATSRMAGQLASAQAAVNQAMELAAKKRADLEAKTRELEQMQAEVDKLQSEIKRLKGGTLQPEQKLKELEEAEKRALDRLKTLEEERDKLKDKLAQILAERTRTEDEVRSKLRELNVSTNTEMHYKLDETMMLLKASVLNLHHDYEFIGSVRSEVRSHPTADLPQIFVQAVQGVRSCIVAAYGASALSAGVSDGGGSPSTIFDPSAAPTTPFAGVISDNLRSLSETSNYAMTDNGWHIEVGEGVLPEFTSLQVVEAMQDSMKRMCIVYDMLPVSSRATSVETMHVLHNSVALYNIATASHHFLRHAAEERERQRRERQSGPRARSRSRDQNPDRKEYSYTKVIPNGHEVTNIRTAARVHTTASQR